MYLCTDPHPHIESSPGSGLDSVRAYRALFSLEGVLRSITAKHSAHIEKTRICADMRIMQLYCKEPLPQAFRDALTVVDSMQKLTL
jgi:hypothetical protein